MGFIIMKCVIMDYYDNVYVISKGGLAELKSEIPLTVIVTLRLGLSSYW